MAVTEHFSVLRETLLATLAPVGDNELLGYKIHKSYLQKRSCRHAEKWEANEVESRSTFVYSARSTRTCRTAFMALTSQIKQTIARHAQEIVESSAFCCYESNLSKSRLG